LLAVAWSVAAPPEGRQAEIVVPAAAGRCGDAAAGATQRPAAACGPGRRTPREARRHKMDSIARFVKDVSIPDRAR
jgi:hypothetical protein